MISWPPITLYLDTPKGQGRVLFVLSAGPDSDLEWTCVYEDGSIWSAMNWEVKVAKNITYRVRNADN